MRSVSIKFIRAAVILTLVVLMAISAAACGEKPAETPAEATQAAAAGTSAPEATEAADSSAEMTDSSREGRQAYYDITGIWMPEAEGFEAEYDANKEQGSIAFDSRGDRALYDAAKAILTQELGAPASEDDISAMWSVQSEDGKTTVNYDIYYHETEDDGVWVYMNSYTQKSE